MNHPLHTIGVIGAGIAGLACARRLHGAGLAVRLFDKGRSPGGRIATRRVETTAGPAQFDHGAQFFTARDPAFRGALKTLPAAASTPWSGPGIGADWRVAAPGMSALARALAAGLDIVASKRVAAIARDGERWAMIGEDAATIGAFDAVIVAAPAEHAAPLLAPIAPHLAQEATDAVTAPCWAGLFAFAESLANKEVVHDLASHPVLGWVACDSAKPGRGDRPHCWVAHAVPDWTRAHLEEAPDTIAPKLLEALASVLGTLPEPILMQAHRWRYAKVERSAGSTYGWDPALKIGACGDWRLGPRVELAWRSGHDLAGAMLA